jgi:hypothetical protein
MVMVGSSWNSKNSAIGYEHRIIASAFLPFSGVFPLEPARTLSPGNSSMESNTILRIELTLSLQDSNMDFRNDLINIQLNYFIQVFSKTLSVYIDTTHNKFY